MKLKKLGLFLILLILSLGTVAGAQSDYWIKDYSMNISVSKNAVNSVLEQMNFYFANPHHGFYRDIPYYYRSENGPSRKIKITSVKCSDPIERGTENDYVSFKIGDGDKVYSGEKKYSLSYLYDIGADTNQDYDEFYFNLVGPVWECPIENFYFEVTIPCSLEDTQNYIFLTRGYYGSTEQVPFSVSETPNGIKISGTAVGFYPGEALTLRVQLPDNWYENARKPFDARSTWVILAPVLSAICALLTLVIWLFFGKDTVPIITARFEAPEGFSPLVEGFLADGTVDDKDITSMLYYWADKGYMTISEQKKNKFVFMKTGDIPLTSPDFERKLFYGFFAGGNVVTFDSLKNSNFYEYMIGCKNEVVAFFKKDRKLKDSKSTLMSGVSFIISLLPLILVSFSAYLYEGAEGMIAGYVILSFVFCFVMLLSFKKLFLRWYLRKNNFFACLLCFVPAFAFLVLVPVLSYEYWIRFLGCALCALLCIFLASITDKRSEYGTKVLEQTLGYREFIEKVQISELVTMIDKDPMLYYHILSYAIVFGLEDKWAKKFSAVAVPPPVWYTGSAAFDYLYFTRMSRRMSNLVRASVSKPAASQIKPAAKIAGSFFGSSGFAGGGFGGGGGRAW